MKRVLVLMMLAIAAGCQKDEAPKPCVEEMVLVSDAAGTHNGWACQPTATLEVIRQASGALVMCHCPRPGASVPTTAEQQEEQPK